MHTSNIFIWVGVLALVMTSCADEDLGPILTFEIAGKGGYIRLIEESDNQINLFDIDGSQYTYSVEFVDLQQGDLTEEYIIEMDYEDADPSDGDQSQSGIPFRTYPASDFADLASGFKGLENITITANEAIAAAGLQPEDVNPGDEFVFNGSVVLEDGSRFSAANSTAPVRGAAFQGHFNYTLPARCPSSLEGTYAYTTTGIWCEDADETSGEVDIEFDDTVPGGDGYTFSDWSFGAYGVCFENADPAGGGSLGFSEVCEIVDFTGRTDGFGGNWEFVSTVDGTEWTIEWSNSFDESGTTVIVNPDGWGFELAE